MTTLRISTKDGCSYDIPQSEQLAVGFFASDRSSTDPQGFDQVAAKSLQPRASNVISEEDIGVLNRTMGTRAGPSVANRILARAAEQSDAVARLRRTWDLSEIDDGAWIDARESLDRALRSVWVMGAGPAITTKLLHLKRPRLVPVVDTRVLWALGTRTDGVDATLAVIDLFRNNVRNNAGPITRIDRTLRGMSIERTRIRILDAVLWQIGAMPHPFSSQTAWATHQLRSWPS